MFFKIYFIIVVVVIVVVIVVILMSLSVQVEVKCMFYVLDFEQGIVLGNGIFDLFMLEVFSDVVVDELVLVVNVELDVDIVMVVKIWKLVEL